MSAPELKTLQATYAGLWQRMTVKPDREASVVSTAHRCLAGKARYASVAAQLGLPEATGWAFIACLHIRESNGNFHEHLHNGDPLTARTVDVPAGRPLTGEPPFTWEESALDALKMRGLTQLAVQLTSVEGFAYAAEGYNGWGYFFHDVTSPYLWGATDCQQDGKYVRDRVWDAKFKDPQIGVMALLKVLMQLDASIVFGPVPVVAHTAAAPAAPTATPAPAPAPAPQGSWVHTLAVTLSTILGAFTSVAQAVDALRPYLENPVVVGAIVAALVALGVITWRAHHAHPAT